MLALPSLRRARLLVPAAQRKVAASAVRRYSVHGDARARISTALLAAGLRSGALAAAHPPAFLDARAARRSPAASPRTCAPSSRPTARSPSTSACRAATASPCCSSASPDGTLLAVAKLGVSALSSRLIRNEAAALTQLAAAPLESRHRPGRPVLRATGARCRCWCSRRCPNSARSRRIWRCGASVPPWRSAVSAASRCTAWPRARCSTRWISASPRCPTAPSVISPRRSLSRLRDAAAGRGAPGGQLARRLDPVEPCPVRRPRNARLGLGAFRFRSSGRLRRAALQRAGRPDACRPARKGRSPTPARDLAALLTPFGVTAEALQPVFVLYLVELLVRYTEDAQARMSIGRRWVDALSGCLESLLADLGSRPSTQRKAS